MEQQALMEAILDFWRSSDAFKQSIATKSEKMSYTFYDGPPFTSGDPHYGHLLQSIVKDMVPRRMAMRGYRVARKRGRDCHGIPAENFVNKQLGITSRKQIEEEFGIGNYVEACRSMVNQVNDARQRFVDHVGRRVDMENAYFTMDNNFMESVIHLFADLYHKNLIYKGFKVLGYSWALGTALSNSEIAEGYEMRQDPAVSVKMTLKNEAQRHERAPHDDGAIEVVAGVLRDAQGRLLMLHDTRIGVWYFPGGKLEGNESPADALKREWEEELGVQVTSERFLGHAKTIHQGKLFRIHYFEVTIEGVPENKEPAKHGMMERVEKIPSENSLGYVLKFDQTIITDEVQLQHDFVDLRLLDQGLVADPHAGEAPVHLLARTTTPWTLPSNMFAAVHEDISYVQVYDPVEQAYFVLAEAVLSKYRKDPNEYIRVRTFLGRELVGLAYRPLFDYYAAHPHIPQSYKEQVHTVLHADFVSVETGTGIVHEAPAFGEDDYELVCTLFPREKAQERLFDPVDAYGNFTALVPDFAGQNVIEANTEIIKELKKRGLLAKHETINHSYPHCPRTKTPLIYKAIESRFVKEDELKTETIPAATSIHFVPEAVKQRFINGLAAAPDRNISRTRFWGSPLPVRESADGKIRQVVGSLEEIYQLNTPTHQLTKVILVRHGRTDYNDQHLIDTRPSDKATINETGKQQAQLLAEQLADVQIDAIYTSPMTRCKQTLAPLVAAKQLHVQEDVRLRDVDNFGYQDKAFDCASISREGGPVDGAQGETIQETAARIEEVYREIITNHPGQTVMICTHGDPSALLRKYMRNTDYKTAKKKLYLSNKHSDQPPMVIEYVRSETGKGLDLHKPYIDDVILVDPFSGEQLRRIPDVLDCRFESGSMPYGQDHFMKKQDSTIAKAESRGDIHSQEIASPAARNDGGKLFSNCADFIAEGLDQTRGWFRALHVLGHAYHSQNVFKNVVVTGMILAEDGKKMSKSLKNYPDPSHVIKQYGADALRLYLLSSPVVRAEPLRFSEKGVEQMLKDVIIPLQNVCNFFSMYADVDHRKHPGTQVRFMRHTAKQREEGKGYDDEGEVIDDKQRPLSAEGFAQLRAQEFVEQVIRIDPEVIVCSDFVRTQQTAEGVQQILKTYLSKEAPLVVSTDRGVGGDEQQLMEHYTQILKKHTGKRILIVSHVGRFRDLRGKLFDLQADMRSNEMRDKYHIAPAQIVKLPLVPLANELDKRILSELHAILLQLDQELQTYLLEQATKTLAGFIDKLTNRYLRRSRRRFWDEQMTDDKEQAYMTLFEVIRTYLLVCAPFIPFTTEDLRQQLMTYSHEQLLHPSLHLQPRPLAAHPYVDSQLMEEIATVRKIIKGALYLRAKHQVKVKQPLQTLEFRI